ncbi:MAG: histidine kinase dimerization/phospho-acceptor domain-containing protein [Pseudomonadota bacterium]|nr:histidine kinase dimerization/phospho-acceptor domain-containing protein [Pseudomonadota bacterium]
MRLRTQLLLVSLTTLLLPWAGCHYVREMEQALRDNQASSLTREAATLARLIQREPLPGTVPDAVFYTPYRHLPVQVDGYGDDWQGHPHQVLAQSPRVTLRQAVDDQHLYLLLQVQLTPLRYHVPGRPFADSDHLRLSTWNGDQRRQWVLFTSGSGALQAQRLTGADRLLGSDPALDAWWQETHQGFNLELAVPRSRLLGHIRLTLHRGTGAGPAPILADSLDPSQGRGHLWLQPLPTLAPLLAPYQDAGRDAVVLSPAGWPLSPQPERVEPMPGSAPSGATGNLLQQGVSRLYRALIDLLTPGTGQAPWPLPRTDLGASETRLPLAPGANPQADWYQLPGQRHSALLVRQPLRVDGELRGYLLLAQTGDALISLTNQALRRVTHLTLVLLVLVLAILVAFASLLSWRIRRLRRAVHQAIAADGRVGRFQASASGDEIGELARSYQSLLQRIRAYTDYLETLSGKLAHELRTPLAITRSSLEMARQQPDNPVYLERAESGVERLRLILSAMSEASRVEQTIHQNERHDFDLVPVLAGLAQAYADTYGEHRFQIDIVPPRAPVRGSPELLAQMLDKLVDNARGFAPAGTSISLGLEPEDGGWRLWLRNEGPPLPEEALSEQLFDSLVSHRNPQPGPEHSAGAATPHLGLGLYIVRLIAHAHGGQVAARNLPAAGGVEFSVSLPTAS